MHIQTSDQEAMLMGFGNYSCNWGLHICGLYETEQERDEILFGFFPSTRNPYFRDPDTWLRENAPEFLPAGR